MESRLEGLKLSALNGSVAALQEFEQIAWRNPATFHTFSIWPVISQVLDTDNVPHGRPNPARTNQILACISLLTTLLIQQRATQTLTLQPHDGSVLWTTVEIWSVRMAQLTGEEQTLSEDTKLVNEVVIHLEELLSQAIAASLAHYYATWNRPRMLRLLSPLYSLLLRTMGSSHLHKPYKLVSVVATFTSIVEQMHTITEDDGLVPHAYDRKASYPALLQIAAAFNNNTLACEQGSVFFLTTLVETTLRACPVNDSTVPGSGVNVFLPMSGAFTTVLRTVSSRRTKTIRNDLPSWLIVLRLLSEITRMLGHSTIPGLRASLGSSLLCAIISIEVQLKTSPPGHLHELQAECRARIVNLIHYVKKLSVWPSVRKIASAQVRAIEKSGIEQRLDPETDFWPAWDDFKQAIMFLDVRDAPIRSYFATCHNSACPSTEVSRVRKCTGCYRAVYCSEACQRNDWRNGAHSKVCKGSLRLANSVREDLTMVTDIVHLRLRASIDVSERLGEANSLLRDCSAQQTPATIVLLLDYQDSVHAPQVAMRATTLEEYMRSHNLKRMIPMSLRPNPRRGLEGQVVLMAPMGDGFSPYAESTHMSILTYDDRIIKQIVERGRVPSLADARGDIM